MILDLFHLIFTHFISSGGLELSMIVLGFAGGILTQFRLPVTLTIFLLRMVNWWLKTHPHGKEISSKTNFDEEFHALFGKYLDNHEAKVDNK